jgi:hypothetical protein
MFDQRPSAKELLTHPWFSDVKTSDGEKIMAEVIWRVDAQAETIRKMHASVTRKYESHSGAVLVTTEEEHEQDRNMFLEVKGPGSSLKKKFMAALSEAKLFNQEPSDGDIEEAESKSKVKSSGKGLRKSQSAQPQDFSSASEQGKPKVMPWDDSMSSNSPSHQIANVP